jgi:hypothetical protein
MGETDAIDGGGGLRSEILLSDREHKKDTAIARRAVREKWPITPSKRQSLVNRLMDVVEKTEVSVTTKDGGVEYAEDPADKNSIAAARVLVAMNGQNQSAAKPAQQPQPQTVVNVVGVNAGAESGRSDLRALIDEFRTRRISGESSAG